MIEPTASERLPRVSVIIPCRNERDYIARCLDSLLASDYPRERLEILVVDGRSEDGTQQIVEAYVQRHACLRLLDNPRKITPVAFNVGIANARGDFIMITGAHSAISPDYISQCVRYSQEYGADNVGGVLRTLPRHDTIFEKGIALALSHVFGVGGSQFRLGPTEIKYVDTVFGGFYRRSVFERIGLFNEKLVGTQDLEFNRRLARAGGRVLLVPTIVAYYYPVSDYFGFCRHNFKNGMWSVLPFLYSKIIPVGIRHLVPLAFVSVLLCCAALIPVWHPVLWLLLGVLGGHSVLNLLASADVAFRSGDIRLFFVMPVYYLSLHLSYGLGSMWGCAKIAAAIIGNAFRRRSAGDRGVRPTGKEGADGDKGL